MSDSQLRRVFRLDPQTLAVIKSLPMPSPVLRHGLRGYDPVEVGALASAGRTIWVGGGAQNLFRLDSSSGRLVAAVPDVRTLGGPEKALVVDGRSLWARGCCPPALTRVDTKTNSAAAVLPLGAGVDELPGVAAGAGAIWSPMPARMTSGKSILE